MAKLTGFVYFIQQVGTPGCVRLGSTGNFKSTVQMADSWSPQGIKVVAYIRSGRYQHIESILQERFKDRRIQGEWFEISTKEIEECIQEFPDSRAVNRLYIPSIFNGWDEMYNYIGNEVYNSDFCDAFKKHVGDSSINNRTILKHLKMFCDKNNLVLEKKRDSSGRFFIIYK